MSVGTVYKGDVSEVTMGHETGLWIQSDITQRYWDATNSASTPDYTTITFEGTASLGDNAIFEDTSPVLKIPVGMLIGAKMAFQRAASSDNVFLSHYYDGANGKIYTIVDHTLTGGKTVLKIVPKMNGISSAGLGS